MTDERQGLPSASAMNRILACPGSHQASKGCSNISSEVSERGTRIHEAVETGDFSKLEEGELEEVEDIIEFINGEKVLIPPGAHEYKEKRLWIKDDLGALMCSGKLDIFWVWESDMGRKALGVDFKTGFANLDPQSDLQLMTQAVALLLNYQVDVVEMGFYFSKAMEYRKVTYLKEDLIQAYHTIINICIDTTSPTASLKPGDHCKYCPAKIKCTAYSNSTLTKLPTMDLSQMADDEIVELVRRVEQWKFFEPTTKAILKEARTRKQFNPEMPGLELVKNPSHRKIMDVGAALYLMREHARLGFEPFNLCEMSAKKAEDFFVEKSKGEFRTKKEARQAFRKRFEGCIDYIQVAPSIKSTQE